MGEYALLKGERVKIGTCDDMYYLRADQAKLVTPQAGNVDPVADREGIRFRFPWPDEDGVKPGDFEQYERSLAVQGIKVPDGVEHQMVQFKADAGYLVSMMCPEGEEGPESDHGLKFHRNGFSGAVHIVQQRWVGEQLVLVCKCGGCGAKYRVPTLEDARPIIDELLRCAKRDDGDTFYSRIAERIEAGYQSQSEAPRDEQQNFGDDF